MNYLVPREIYQIQRRHTRMLLSTERINNTIFSRTYDSVRLNLSITVLVGKSNAAKEKLSPIYSREYSSEKYSNVDMLNIVEFTHKDYFVLSYNDWENKLNEEIFVSYPDVDTLIDFFTSAYELVSSNEVFNKKNQVYSGHEDDTIISEAFPSYNDEVKYIRCMPVSLPVQSNPNALDRGLYLLINGDDNYIAVTEYDIYNILCNLMNHNLAIESLITFNIAMGMGGTSEIGGGSSSNAPRSRRPIGKRKPLPGRGPTSGMGKSRKPSRAVDDEYEEEYEEEEEVEEEEYEEEEETYTPKRRKASVAKSPAKKGKSASTNKAGTKRKSSLSNLMEEADGIQFSEDDDDEDEE